MSETKKYDAEKTEAEHVAEIKKASFDYLFARIDELEALYHREREVSSLIKPGIVTDGD